MFECITGLLVGNPLVEAELTGVEGERRHNQNGLLIAIDIGQFIDVEAYGASLDRMVALIKDLPKAPVNSYGETKLIFEQMLRWFDEIHGLRSVSLRYFNAAGATAALGEDHTPETKLIPLAIFAAMGKTESVEEQTLRLSMLKSPKC